MRAVDVLGFAGGFTLGVVQAGFELVGKKEMPGGFGVANCEVNRHLLGYQWRADVGVPESWSKIEAEFVFGNPPCSGFSVMSAKEFRGADSKINHCMWAFAEYVARVNPLVAVFESVQPAYTRPDGRDLMRSLRELLVARTGHAWSLTHVLHNAYSLGGSAQRRRYFWVASRVPFGVEEHPLRKLPLLDDVIRDLDNLADTWVGQPYRQPPTWWSESRRSSTGTVDGHIIVRNPLTRRLADLMQGIEWHPGEDVARVVRRYYETRQRLPDSWSATQDKLIKNDFFMGFTTPVRWDGRKPARVITGGGLIMVVHPYLDRTITHRETARILGFPDDWRIAPLRGNPGLQMTWGKGITVDCGRWIAQWVKRSIEGNPGSVVGEAVGEAERVIDVTNSYKKFLVQ